MIGYIILVLVQLAAGWFAAPKALEYVPLYGDPQIFARAAIYAVIVWIVGIIGSFVLKDVRLPTSATLASALFLAIVGAGLTLIPAVMQVIPVKPPYALPLFGAVLGYLIRR